MNIKNDINLTRLLIIDSNDVGVYSELGDIKHHSTANIQSKTSYAIFVENGNIELNGDITATGRLGGIYAKGKNYNSTRRGRVTVIGTLKVETEGLAGSGVSGEKGVTLEGEINVINKNKTGGNGITSGGLVTLSGNISSEAPGYRAISGDSVIIKNGSSIIAKGEEGIYAKKKIEMEGGDLEATGTERHAIFVENGSIELNGDITATGRLGGIYAKGVYDQYTPRGHVTVIGTLKVETDGLAGSGVSGESGVTLEGEINVINKNKTGGNGITSGRLVTLSGNISSEAPGYRAISGDSVIIKNGSSIIAKGEEGIYAKKKIEMEGGTLEATGTNGYAISASKDILINDGYVHAKGTDGAIYSNTGTITIHSPLAITTPDGGRVSGKTIVGSDGKTATEVVIQNRPLPGSVSIANGVLAEVGDVLTLDFSSDFPWSGRSVQWQKEVGGGTWEDIPGETHWTYTAKAADQGRAFRVKVSVAGYSGEKFSNPCTILVKPTLGGSVAYNGVCMVGKEYRTSRQLTPAGIPAERIHYQWQISSDGNGGWTDIPGATDPFYTPVAADAGKYIRMVVTASGYSGAVYGAPRKVGKQNNDADPVAPQLSISDPYSAVTITNAKADQEYAVTYSFYEAPNWAGATHPNADGSFNVSAQKDRTVYVHTRMRETDSKLAGTKTAYNKIYNGVVSYLADLTLDKSNVTTKVGEVTKLTVSPLPEDFSGWNNEYTVRWYVNGSGVQLWANAACSIPVPTTATYHKTVYVKATAQTAYVQVGVEKQVGMTDVRNAFCTFEVADVNGNLPLQKLNFEDVTMWAGETTTVDYTTAPTPALVGTLSFVKNSGPSGDLTLTAGSGSTVTITAPSDAAPGDYFYGVKVDGSDTSTLSFIKITVLTTTATVTLSANNGNPAENITQTVEIGSEFILPELPDSFTKPSDFDFGGWDKGAVGEGILIEGDTEIKANWVPHVHNMVFVPGFEATCVWDGNAEHYHCTVCGKDFDDADGSTEAPTADYYIIPATGHTPGTAVKENEIDATCIYAGGYDEVVYCTVCYVELSRTHTDIPVTAHTLTHVPAKAATCTEDGNHAYYECSVCGDRFEDAAGAVKITDYLSVIIDALGHDWGEWVQTKAPTTTEEGEETRTCKHDSSHTETRSIPVLGHVHVMTHVAFAYPTCEADGVKEHYECSSCGKWYWDNGGENEITDKADVVLAKLDHDWGEWTQTKAPTTTEEGEETRTCKHDSSHTETRSIAKLGVTSYTVTVQNDGNGTASASAGTSEAGKEITLTATPNSGYKFKEWQSSDVTVTGDKFTMPEKNVTVTAIFEKIPTGAYTVTFNPNGGSVTPTSGTTGTDGKLTSLPTPDTRTNYTFDGWFTAASGGDEVDETTVFTADSTIYAHWTYTGGGSSGGGGGGITTKYTLTYNTGGGSSITATKHNSGTTVNLTATPTREGFTFDGWYSEASLTNKITSIKMNGNKTVYAGWKETGSGTPDHDCPSRHLKDVDENAWYHEYVDYVVEKGLMQGVADDLFAPNVTTSRAMIVTILHRLEGKPAPNGKASFDDVVAGSWYADAVAWAEENDIVNGYGGGKFGPNDLITREQFAAIMYRYANFKGYNTGKAVDLSAYADASAISDWALAAMKWANAENFITGRTTTTLVPRGDATRAEAAAILKRFIENVK